MLQVWTEFVSAPAPSIYSPAETSEISDQQLDFGGMMIGPGKAFLIGTAADQYVRVQKQWLQTEGRTFLFEQIPVESITTEPQQLAPSHATTRAIGPAH